MMLLQLSAGQGPAECCLALARALPLLLREAAAGAVAVDVVETEAGPEPGTWRSLLLSLDGAGASELAARWTGTLLWICPSPYRPRHGRKNWFFGGSSFQPPAATLAGEVRFEALRASGPGGQHVNKTSSAIRATHLASGISVKVQAERSQHANRRLALLLISQRLAQMDRAAAGDLRASRRQAHHQLERGAPCRVFRGEAFLP